MADVDERIAGLSGEPAGMVPAVAEQHPAHPQRAGGVIFATDLIARFDLVTDGVRVWSSTRKLSVADNAQIEPHEPEIRAILAARAAEGADHAD